MKKGYWCFNSIGLRENRVCAACLAEVVLGSEFEALNLNCTKAYQARPNERCGRCGGRFDTEQCLEAADKIWAAMVNYEQGTEQ